jgi:beta-glucanase (GH16 family)
MINLRILFGWIPKTAEYEARQEALRKEFTDLDIFSKSEELAGYLALEKLVLSPDFARRKKDIAGARYADTPEYRKEKEYLSLKKRKEIQRYYKTKGSVELRDFLEFEKSYDLKHFHTLETFVHSADFIRTKKELRKTFIDSPEYEKWQEFNLLKKSERIRDHLAFKVSRDYVNFTLLIGSEKINAFEQLEHYVQSADFKKVKEYMLLSGKEKLARSEEYAQEQKYLELKNTDTFKWYLSTKDSKKFNEIRRWKQSFYDDFNSHALDRKKWLTRHFWGETLLKDSYVNEGEKQFYAEDKNIELGNSVLKITTRKQKVRGKTWNPAIGFYPHDFDYTSGIINTGSQFRQQFGLFEAKIRFNLNHPVTHGFWLVSEVMLPQIDVARAAKNIMVGTYFGDPNVKGGIGKQKTFFSRSRYGTDYQIFSLEWSKERLTWKLNGIPIYSTTQGVPQVPMYVNIGSALYTDVNGSTLPAEVDVDWVRCYTPA